jgi:hypothetical protein
MSGILGEQGGEKIHSERLMYPEYVQINNGTNNTTTPDITVIDTSRMSKQSVDKVLGYAPFFRTGIVPSGKSGLSLKDTRYPSKIGEGVGTHSDIDTGASQTDDDMNQQGTISQTMPEGGAARADTMGYDGSQPDAFNQYTSSPRIPKHRGELTKEKHSDKQHISTSPFLLDIPTNEASVNDVSHPERESFLLDTPPIDTPLMDNNQPDFPPVDSFFSWHDHMRNYTKNARAAGWYLARTNGMQAPIPEAASSLAHSTPDGQPLRQLYIGGLFELSGSYVYGRSELEAAQMAIRHINKQRYVPGYELVLLANDTRVRNAAMSRGASLGISLQSH